MESENDTRRKQNNVKQMRWKWASKHSPNMQVIIKTFHAARSKESVQKRASSAHN